MTTLVTAVEVRTSKASTLTAWDMPVRVEKRGDLTALVFSTEAGVWPVVTVLLTASDRASVLDLLDTPTFDVKLLAKAIRMTERTRRDLGLAYQDGPAAEWYDTYAEAVGEAYAQFKADEHGLPDDSRGREEGRG